MGVFFLRVCQFSSWVGWVKTTFTFTCKGTCAALDILFVSTLLRSRYYSVVHSGLHFVKYPKVWACAGHIPVGSQLHTWCFAGHSCSFTLLMLHWTSIFQHVFEIVSAILHVFIILPRNKVANRELIWFHMKCNPWTFAKLHSGCTTISNFTKLCFRFWWKERARSGTY